MQAYLQTSISGIFYSVFEFSRKPYDSWEKCAAYKIRILHFDTIYVFTYTSIYTGVYIYCNITTERRNSGKKRCRYYATVQ
jgi:hypothetical protein